MKRFPGLRLGLLILLAIAAAGRSAYATDATVVADASVNSAHPSTNFGALSNLYVGNGNTALIQFDLSSLPSGSSASQIARATLRLYVNRVNTAGTISLQPVTSAWTELGVTQATIPSIGTTVASFTASSANQFVIVDVTALVQAWVTTPASNFGLALSSTGANVLFDSKENDETSHVAHLDITLVSQGPAGPTGPQGPAGPAGTQGPAGVAGPVGPAGPAGAQGSVGPAGPVGLTYLQAWNKTTAYVATDSVTFAGSTYIALSANTNEEPDVNPAVWSVIAMAGAPGAAGATGPQGAPGPSGAQGPAGPAGPTGATGPAGPTGATGAQGAAGTFSFASDYAAATSYDDGQVVFCATTCSTNGSSYISLGDANLGFDPPTNPTRWALIAQAGAAGAPGQAGPQGPAGATGAQGPAGPAGATGSTGTISFASNYSGTVTYSLNQVVFCAATCTTNGSSYVSLGNANQGFDPPTNPTKWALIAQAGATGAPGAQGPIGATGSQGPTGATGAQGPAGPAGPAGPTGATGGSSHVFLANVLLGTVSGSTEFFAPTSSGDPSLSNAVVGYNSFATVLPVPCTFDSLYLATGQSGYGTFTSPITVTLFQNGVATGLAASIQPATTNTLVTSQTTGQSVAVAAGDTLALQASSSSFSTSGSGPYAFVSVSLHCQ